MEAISFTLDAQEALLQRDSDILRPTDYNYTISFIGSAMEANPALVNSIRSINTIAEELGREFEIIVSHRHAPESIQPVLRELRKTCSNLVLLESGLESFGQGKSIAFNYSTGKFVVPFNAGITYPIGYSDVLHDFLKFKLKRLYYSELSLVSREIIAEVGGWRNLSNGEDIDLFSRISINYGVFACPTNLLQGDDQFKRELISIRGFPMDQALPFGESYRHLKDLIISCNHSLKDLRAMKQILKQIDGNSRFWLFMLSYLGSKFSHIKPVSYNRNNYIIFMESVLESIILKEFLKMADVNYHMAWNIDKAHIRFLAQKSKLFREMKDSTIAIFKDQL